VAWHPARLLRVLDSINVDRKAKGQAGFLAVAVHNHYKRLNAAKRGDNRALRSTSCWSAHGCGKTFFLAQTLARILDVPLYHGRCDSRLTEAGYVGED